MHLLWQVKEVRRRRARARNHNVLPPVTPRFIRLNPFENQSVNVFDVTLTQWLFVGNNLFDVQDCVTMVDDLEMLACCRCSGCRSSWCSSVLCNGGLYSFVDLF